MKITIIKKNTLLKSNNKLNKIYKKKKIKIQRFKTIQIRHNLLLKIINKIIKK